MRQQLMTNVESKKKKVLIVSFHFPPANTIAAVRIGKFAKYLPDFGWEPFMLTVDNCRESPQSLSVEMDKANIVRTPYYDGLVQSVIHKLNSGEKTSQAGVASSKNTELAIWKKLVYKAIRPLKPICSLPLVDELVYDPLGWYRPAVRIGTELATKNNIDLIYSSYKPATCHFIASRLHQKTGIPWMAEFRDLWSLNAGAMKIQPLSFLRQQWERRTMKDCNVLVSVSQFWADQLEKLHSKRTIVISNGFDEVDYKRNIPFTRKFTITYTGTVYPHRGDPTLLLLAIAALKQEGSISPNDLIVRFFGSNVMEIVPPLVEEYGLTEFVQVYGHVSFSESIQRQKESTVLLLLRWNHEKDKGMLTGKIFEYMGAKRPILASAFKDGAIASLLKESGCGVVANEVGKIKDILIRWIEEFKEYGEVRSYYHPDESITKSYTRREQTRKLARVFNEVIDNA